MMAPPHSLVKIGGGKDDGWKNYRLDLFFCDSTYHSTKDGRAYVTNINDRTRTSTEPGLDIWSRMDTCAVDFLRVLSNYQTHKPEFRLLSTQNNFIVPFSEVSIDRASGVKLSFDFQLFIGCEITDYPEIDYEQF